MCSCLPFRVLVQITTDLYEADLEKALILSKLEFEQKQVHEPHTSMIVFIVVVNDHWSENQITLLTLFKISFVFIES